MKIMNIVILLAALILSIVAEAAVSPLAISIGGPAQFPPRDFDITGARVSLLYGQSRDVYGIDLGVLGNITTGKFTGIGVSGLFNNTRGQTTITGLQFAGLANINSQKTSVYGIQASLGANYNSAESKIVGLQFAPVNISAFSKIYGFQVGLYNKAREVRGFQIGVINVAQNLKGIQIGLLNFHHDGIFVVSPFINIGF